METTGFIADDGTVYTLVTLHGKDVAVDGNTNAIHENPEIRVTGRRLVHAKTRVVKGYRARLTVDGRTIGGVLVP